MKSGAFNSFFKLKPKKPSNDHYDVLLNQVNGSQSMCSSTPSINALNIVSTDFIDIGSFKINCFAFF